jgi:hypothetical protein
MLDEQESRADLEQVVPRERIGPFLLLGLDKGADAEQIETQWARSLIAARRGRTRVGLADINWARTILNDPEARARADIASLNAGTIAGDERATTETAGQSMHGTPTWKPMDDEQQPTDFVPTTVVPDPAEIRRGIVLPIVPADVPGAFEVVRRLLIDPVDPWQLDLPPTT